MKISRTKVFLKDLHVAYVNTALKTHFQSLYGITNYMAWVRQQSVESFGILLDSEDSLRALQVAVSNHYYDSIGEWLNERMRYMVQQKMKKRNNEAC